jgi:FAD-linked sulfhydryl oxidase
MKLPPTVWGPLFWHTIHIVALGYSNSPSYAQKRAAKEFYESFSQLIPCAVCREHYITHLSKNPISPHLDRRDDLFRWTVNLHNEVNVSLGKSRMLESSVLYYYRRIGAIGKNPVIDQNALDEIDLRSAIKGGAVGGGIVFGVGLLFWMASAKE